MLASLLARPYPSVDKTIEGEESPMISGTEPSEAARRAALHRVYSLLISLSKQKEAAAKGDTAANQAPNVSGKLEAQKGKRQ